MNKLADMKGSYKKLHPSFYTLQANYFKPEFLQAVTYAKSPHASAQGLAEFLQEEAAANVFSLPVFTREFCGKFMEELEHFQSTDFPKGRPNTMNRGGLLLFEMGFDEGFMDPFRTDYLLPVAQLLYPDWVGRGLDSHRAFVVKYSMEDDVELSYHFDNAEVTLNVCLGLEFTGGDLYFGSMRTERGPGKHERWTTYHHSVGRGLLHRAQHMHGARPITSGYRYNLIIWMRSSSVRNTLCPMCNEAPTLVATRGCGDGFTVR